MGEGDVGPGGDVEVDRSRTRRPGPATRRTAARSPGRRRCPAPRRRAGARRTSRCRRRGRPARRRGRRRARRPPSARSGCGSRPRRATACSWWSWSYRRTGPPGIIGRGTDRQTCVLPVNLARICSTHGRPHRSPSHRHRPPRPPAADRHGPGHHRAGGRDPPSARPARRDGARRRPSAGGRRAPDATVPPAAPEGADGRHVVRRVRGRAPPADTGGRGRSGETQRVAPVGRPPGREGRADGGVGPSPQAVSTATSMATLVASGMRAKARAVWCRPARVLFWPIRSVQYQSSPVPAERSRCTRNRAMAVPCGSLPRAGSPRARR